MKWQRGYDSREGETSDGRGRCHDCTTSSPVAGNGEAFLT